MRITVNPWCNVRTLEHTANPRSSVDITIPSFRAVLSVQEAEALLTALAQAIDVAKKEGKE